MNEILRRQYPLHPRTILFSKVGGARQREQPRIFSATGMRDEAPGRCPDLYTHRYDAPSEILFASKGLWMVAGGGGAFSDDPTGRVSKGMGTPAGRAGIGGFEGSMTDEESAHLAHLRRVIFKRMFSGGVVA